MSRYNGIRPVTNGLVFCIDPTNRQSYVSGSTLVNDLVGTTTGATLFNGPTFSTGSTSNYITFDGTNDYFLTNYNNQQSDHTIISFVKLSTLNDDWIPIIEFGTTGGSPFKAHYYVQGLTNNFNAPYSYRGFGANFYNGSSNTNDQWYSPVLYETNANEWMMLTGRVSGTTIGDTFVNKIKSRPTTACTYSNQSIISIANSRPLNSFYYGGNLGLVLYYNRALTDNEIIQTYNAYQNRFNLPGDIVTNGLVLNLDTAYYNSYPRSGTTWSDLSGNGNNGTLTNGVTFNVSGDSSSMQFDGVDDFVQLANQIQFERTNSFSFNIWFKFSNSNFMQLINNQNSSYVGYEFAKGTDNVVYFIIGRATGNYISVNITNPLTVNTWVNICVTYNGTSLASGINMYLNGVLTGTTIGRDSLGTQTNISNFPTLIGKRSPISQGFFNGNISNVQIYNRALSATEVSQNFNALRGRFGI